MVVLVVDDKLSSDFEKEELFIYRDVFILFPYYYNKHFSPSNLYDMYRLYFNLSTNKCDDTLPYRNIKTRSGRFNNSEMKLRLKQLNFNFPKSLVIQIIEKVLPVLIY